MEVSIIIPVYNTDVNKLKRCLDSVLCQEYKGFECIVVDDGSNYSVGALCDEYALKDGRFKVIHKANGGVSSARNTALDVAKGTWIVFIDSDDYVEKNHLSVLLSKISDDVDIVLASFRFIHSSQVTKHQYDGIDYIGKENVCHFICHSDFLLYQTPWDKMYRRSVIIDHDVRFDESLSLSEDRLFCYDALIFISGIATISEITYIHDGTDTSTLSYRTPDMEMQKHLCEKISDATTKIVKHYCIPADDMLLLWKYNWSILELLMRHTYNVKSNIFKVAKKQKNLFAELFNWALYNQIKDSKIISQYMNDVDKQLIISTNFLVYDFRLLIHFFKVKFFGKRFS